MSGTLSITDAGYTVGVNVRITQRNAKTGRVMTTREGHNRCTRTQLLGITKWLNGEFNETQPFLLSEDWIPRYLAVGTNLATMDSSTGITTEVTVNDTRLLTELSPRIKLPERNKIINSSTQSYVQLVISTYLPQEYYNNETIREAGLFSKESGNNCLFRIAFEGIQKTEDSVIEITWTISVISVDSKNDAYESVDKTDLRSAMQQLLDKFGELNPDISTACKHLDLPAISCYGREDVSQEEISSAINVLAEDYKNIKDLEPGSKVIPDGYINTNDSTATENDILRDKTAYVNGNKVTGTIDKYDKLTEFKDSYSDLSLETITTNTKTDNYFKIKSNLKPGLDGKNCLIESGNFNLDINIPQDILATFLGITPEKIKFGETILGIRGTYNGEQK